MTRHHALAIARQTRAHVVGLLDALDPVDFLDTAPLAVQAGRDRATALGDVSIASKLDRLPLGLVASDAVDRLTAALTGILDDEGADGDPTARVGRLAEAEPLDAWRSSSLEATRAHDARAERIADDNACPLCIDLAGPVPDFVTEPFTHAGCGCSIEPVA